MCLDEPPHVELGPVRQWVDPDVLTFTVTRVVQAPQFRALVLRVPLTEAVAEGEHPLLGAGLVLVAAAAAEDGVEAAVLDPFQQGDGLVAVAAFQRVADLDPAGVDQVLHRGHLQPQPVARRLWRSRNSITSGKLWPGVDVHDRERDRRRRWNALRARCSIRTESLPPEKSITGCSNSADDFADDEDRLRLEGVEVRQLDGGRAH